MILVDTSVWIDHFRSGDHQLTALLEGQRVLLHPMVLGELAMGRWRDRDRLLGDLVLLPRPVVAADAEVLRFIEAAGLAGRGIGYVDAHLLAAVRLTPGSELWTRDRRLLGAAQSLALASSG